MCRMGAWPPHSVASDPKVPCWRKSVLLLGICPLAALGLLHLGAAPPLLTTSQELASEHGVPCACVWRMVRVGSAGGRPEDTHCRVLVSC